MKLVDIILRRKLLVNPDLSSTQPDLMGRVTVPLSEGTVIGNLHKVELITFSRMHPTNGVYYLFKYSVNQTPLPVLQFLDGVGVLAVDFIRTASWLLHLHT